MFKKQLKYNFSNIISKYKGGMITFLSILLIFTFSIITLNVTAAPDNELTYHGKLTDATLDTAVADGDYDFTLSIYDASSGGTLLWTSGLTVVPIENGIFSTTLTSLGGLEFDENYYLGVVIEGNPEMSPRRKITPTGFAMNAHRLNGEDESFYLNTSNSSQIKQGNLTLNGDLAVDGMLYDSNTDEGSNGQILSSTVTGTNWIDNDFLTLSDTMNSFTEGSILFTSPTAVTENNADFFWDNSSSRLGINTNNPETALDVHGGIKIGNESSACIPVLAGTTRYNSTNQTLELCDGSDWQELNTGASGGGNGETIPAGTVMAYTVDTCPTNWIEAEGQEISRAGYPDLYTTLGDTYGNGDGSTTFDIPDYRGQFLRGWDNGAGTDPDAASRTDRGDGTTGDVVGSKQDGQNEAHQHSVNPPSTNTNTTGNHTHGYTVRAGTGTDAGGATRRNDESGATTTDYTGASGNHSHSVNIPAFNSANSGGNETRPTNINVLYCIKTTNNAGGTYLSALWDADTDTGIQTDEGELDDDTIRFDTAGTERMQLTATGNLIPSQTTNDLGTDTSRWNDLYISSNTLHIGSSSADEGLISYDTSGNILNFKTDATTNGDIAFNTDDLFIDKLNSRIGMGTASPGVQLDLAGIADASGVTNTGVFEIGGTLRMDGDEIITNTNSILYIQNDNDGDLQVDGGTLFADASTNRIGIGTTTPTSKLHVIGGAGDTSPNSAGIQIGSDSGSNYAIEMTNDGGTPYIDFQNDIAGTDYDMRVILSDNNTLAINGGNLEVAGSIYADIFYDRNNTGYHVDPASTTRLNIVYNYGNTHIGSAASSASDLYLADRMYDWDNTGYYLDMDVISRINRIDANDIRADIFYDRNNTGYYLNPADTSRIENMEIDGDNAIGALRIDDSSIWAGLQFDPASGNNTTGIAAYYDSIYFTRSNDNFGSWINNPFQFDLDVGAAYNATGTWGTQSDSRLKTNIVSIDSEDALNLLIQLQGVNYDWINPENHGDILHNAGFIAQDIEELFPQWVSEVNVGGSDVNLIKEGRAKAFGLPHQFSALLVESIKEQNQLITTNSNNINLNATTTSVSELQVMVKDELIDFTGQVEDLSLQVDANELAVQAITDIEGDIFELRSDLSILTTIDTRVLTLNVDKLMFVSDGILTQSTVDKDGIETIEEMVELTLEGILITKKLVTKELETNALTITVGDDDVKINTSSAGDAIIEDGDTYIDIVTSAIGVDSKIFVTARGERAVDVSLTVTEVIDGQCTISILEANLEDIAFDWFVIN